MPFLGKLFFRRFAALGKHNRDLSTTNKIMENFFKKPSKVEFPSVEKKGSLPVCALFSPWLRQAGVPYQEHSRRAVCHRNRPERERAGSDSVRWGRAGGAGKVTSGQEGIKDT